MTKKPRSRKKLTRQEQRDLDLEISFMEGLLQREPRYVEALQVLGDDYTRRGNFGAGVKVDEKLVQLRPDDPMTHYNLACSYALLSQFEPAVTALERAIARGFNDFKSLLKDPDLAELRQHPLFKKLETKIRPRRIKVQ
jgi:tetratricopeptide (TPR) repeat protein